MRTTSMYMLLSEPLSPVVWHSCGRRRHSLPLNLITSFCWCPVSPFWLRGSFMALSETRSRWWYSAQRLCVSLDTSCMAQGTASRPVHCLHGTRRCTSLRASAYGLTVPTRMRYRYSVRPYQAACAVHETTQLSKRFTVAIFIYDVFTIT